MAVDFLNTKFSDIDLEFIKNYLRIEPEMIEDDIEITLFIEAAKSYIIKESQMTLEEVDETKQLNIPYVLMIAEIYQNRSLTADKTNVNPVFKLMIDNVRKYNL